MGFTNRDYWGLVAAVVAGVFLCSRVAAETNGGRPQVHVLIYNSARIPVTVVERAGTEAVRIFRASGIALEWVNCSGRSAVAECRVHAASNPFVLHIVQGGKTSTDSAYGEAFLAENGSGKYADVFFDRVESAHRDCGVDVARLVGAVAAHEIGHLLLGLHAHSWMGIMAPVWEKESLRQVDMGRLFFTREQAVRMRERMRRGDVKVASLGESRD